MIAHYQFNEIIKPILAIFFITTASNYLVEIPINDWLTWGAFTYPLTFLVTELTNRSYGPSQARKMVYIAFFFTILLTFSCMNPRIAMASSLAFLIGQLLDISIFTKLRKKSWWVAPAFSSIIASFIDTAVFFSVAFAGEQIPWVTLAIGDFGVKFVVDLLMLLPFRFAIQHTYAANT